MEGDSIAAVHHFASNHKYIIVRVKLRINPVSQLPGTRNGILKLVEFSYVEQKAGARTS